MNVDRFDGWLREATRRGLLGAVLVFTATPVGRAGVAARKRKPRTGQPNEFGCLNVGDRCQRSRQCCSSICGGKKGRKRCKAHDKGGCAAGGQPEGCGGTDVACITSLDEEGTCATTTGNAGYCQYGGDCYPCTTDAECQTAAGGMLGPRAACIRCAECTETGGAACATPRQIVAISPGKVQR